MQRSGRVAGVLFSLLLVGAVASACGSSSATSGGGGSTTTERATTPASAGTAPTLASLTSSVQAQLTSTDPSGFAVNGLRQLTCTPPATWAVGATFKCVAYDFARDEIGEYDGTVRPASGGVPKWNGLWSPK
jgi:hypothetical protein